MPDSGRASQATPAPTPMATLQIEPLDTGGLPMDGSRTGVGGGQVQRLLHLARTHLGMEIAWISQFTGGEQVIQALAGDGAAMNVQVGAATALEGSFCVRVMAGTLAALIPHARRDPVTRELAVTADLGIGSYVGAPLHGPSGEVVGMLCCLSRSASPHLDGAAPQFLALIADLISDHLTSPAGLAARSSAQDTQRVAEILAGGRIRMVFQPIVDLSDKRAVAFEALARFDPAHFPDPTQAFAAATNAGLGPDLEFLAIQQAFTHLDDLAPGIWLGVNLSAQALLVPAIQERVLQLAARRIAVEITEHTQVHDYDQLTTVTTRLQESGIHIVIDDAGAGYASLRHILRLHPNAIKLDLDLVRGIDTDPVRQALTRSMVMFAAEIGARLIAEGIETPTELATLQHLGVRLGQGYLLARPGDLPPPP